MTGQLFHCGICHRETPDMTKHLRDMHSGGYPMTNGCELQRCPKWQREHPEEPVS